MTTSTNPAILVWVSLSTKLPIAAAPAPRSDEDDGEADDERDARDDDATTGAGAFEPVDVDRRDRGEVAGDERQHARRHDGGEPCEERDRQLLKHRSRASSSSTRPLELGIERRRCVRLATGAHDFPPRATTATRRRRGRTPPTRIPPIGRPRRSGRTRASAARRAPTVRTRRRASCSICDFVPPPRCAALTNAFISRAIGASDSSSVVWQVGQTRSRSSSPCVGCRSLATAGAAAASRRPRRGGTLELVSR